MRTVTYLLKTNRPDSAPENGRAKLLLSRTRSTARLGGSLALPGIFPQAGSSKSGYGRRAAFTLIELLVATSIFLILAGLTFAVILPALGGGRVRAGGRQLQAILEGARNRAIHAGKVRGVRLILDPNATTPNVVRSFIYIGAPSLHTTETVSVAAGSNLITPTPTAGWTNLQTRGLLVDGSRIKIAGAGVFYTVVFDPAGSVWKLTKNFVGTTDPTATYELELQPTVLPNQEAQRLPNLVVIDLGPIVAGEFDHSQAPSSWLSNLNRMDILFSPHGIVVGSAAGAGLIHLVVADQADVDNGLLPGDPAKQGEELIITLTSQTGKISSHSVFSTADKFFYAETGRVAK